MKTAIMGAQALLIIMRAHLGPGLYTGDGLDWRVAGIRADTRRECWKHHVLESSRLNPFRVLTVTRILGYEVS